MGFPTTVILLFTKNMWFEPPAILQCDKSGKYFHFYFYDWRDSIHYLLWCKSMGYYFGETKIFHEWSVKYGYDSDEQFLGDLNEFRCDENKENKISIDTSICTISECTNLNKKTAW
jgi:hypothetical protein